MTKRDELIKKIEVFQLTTDVVKKEDQPFIPNWNYELLADFIIDRERAMLERIKINLHKELLVEDSQIASEKLAGNIVKEAQCRGIHAGIRVALSEIAKEK